MTFAHVKIRSLSGAKKCKKMKEIITALFYLLLVHAVYLNGTRATVRFLINIINCNHGKVIVV